MNRTQKSRNISQSQCNIAHNFFPLHATHNIWNHELPSNQATYFSSLSEALATLYIQRLWVFVCLPGVSLLQYLFCETTSTLFTFFSRYIFQLFCNVWPRNSAFVSVKEFFWDLRKNIWRSSQDWKKKKIDFLGD